MGCEVGRKEMNVKDYNAIVTLFVIDVNGQAMYTSLRPYMVYIY